VRLGELQQLFTSFGAGDDPEGQARTWFYLLLGHAASGSDNDVDFLTWATYRLHAAPSNSAREGSRQSAGLLAYPPNGSDVH
jgi:hypothetical protein